MRYTMSVIPFLLVAGFAMGCTSNDAIAAAPLKSDETTKPVETASVELKNAKTETNEAAQALKDYANAEKNEFVDNMKKGLVEIQVEIDRMSTEIDRSGSAAKADAEAKLDAMREKWAKAKKQLDQIEIATESNWNENVDGFNQSYSDLTVSFNTTRQWLSDKIEP